MTAAKKDEELNGENAGNEIPPTDEGGTSEVSSEADSSVSNEVLTPPPAAAPAVNPVPAGSEDSGGNVKPPRHLDVEGTGEVIDASGLDPNVPRGLATGQSTQFETGPRVEPPTPSLATNSDDTRWWFCLDARHQAGLDDASRLFVGVVDGCPVCPVCKDEKGNPVQVNAVPAEEGRVPDLRPRLAAGYGN